MSAKSFFGGAFFGGEFFTVPTPDAPSGGGGGAPPLRIQGPLPQYYSRRVLDERVSLPQEPHSNAVAIAVLDDARELEARLSRDERGFAEMLETTDHMLKQVAVFVESQQIYNIVRTIEARVQARKDAIQAAEDEEDKEINELIDGGFL